MELLPLYRPAEYNTPVSVINDKFTPSPVYVIFEKFVIFCTINSGSGVSTPAIFGTPFNLEVEST